MISEITIENFKGASGRYHFGPATLITGRNFSCKSAIREAIQLAVLGYIPGAPATIAGIKKYASAMPLSVEAKVETGGAPKTLRVALDNVKGAAKKTDGRTLAELGSLDDQTKVLFDPSIFFGLSDDARISLACELVQSEGGKPQELRSILAAKLTAEAARYEAPEKGGNAELEGEAPAHALAMTKIYGEWYETVFSAAKVMNDLLSRSEDFFKEQKKQHSAEVKRLQKTAEGLTDLSTLEAELSRLPAQATAEATKHEISEKLRSLTVKIAAALAVAGQAARLKVHKDRAAELPGLLTEKAAKDKELAGLVAEVATLTAKVEELRHKHKTTLDALEKLKASGPAEAPMREDDFESHSEYGKRYLVTAVIVAGVSAEPGLTQVDKIQSWREIVEPSPEAEEQLQMEICNASEEIENIEAEGKEARGKLDIAEGAKRLVEGVLRELAKKISQAEASKEELENSKASSATATDAELDAWKAEHTAAKAQLDAADATVMQIVRFDQDRKRVKEAAAKRDSESKVVDALSEALDLISAKKGELVSGSIEKPLAIANKLGCSILRGPLVMEQGELGMRVGQKFVSAAVFSGAEKALLMMGLTAGLAARSKLRVLMLDEIATVDALNLGTLMQNLSGMVQDGDIDQFILFGTDYSEIAQAAAANAVTVIDAGAQAVAA